jgi:hypothetical protein
MAFIAIENNIIKVGDPITKEIMDLIKDNFDDLNTRVSGLSVSGGSIYIFNGDVSLIGYSALHQDIFYYKAKQDFSVNEFSVQLFSKQGITSGDLVLDLQKASNTNDANFSTILTAPLSFNFSSAADYSSLPASIDSGANNITTSQVLRVKITNVPAGFSGSILINVGAA